MTKSRRAFLCLDCGEDTGRIHEYYMLKDSVWFTVHNSDRGMLCIGCCEDRLGRQLVPDDFANVYVNNPKFAGMSLRLYSRIIGEL